MNILFSFTSSRLCFAFCLLGLLLGGTGCTKRKKRKASPLATPSTTLPLEEQKKIAQKNIKDLTLDELWLAKTLAVAQHQRERALAIIDRLIVITTDQAQLEQLRFERANLYFELGKFEKAGDCYKKYSETYPRSEHKDEVKYREVLCRFYLTFECDRDQSKTKDALALANEYLANEMVFNTYQRDVKDIQKRCVQKLLDTESYIFSFYLKKGSTKAAEKRLTYIKEHYLPVLQELKPQILTLEYDLATQKGDHERLAALAHELKGEAPDKIQQLAHNTSTAQTSQAPGKKDYVTRF